MSVQNGQLLPGQGVADIDANSSSLGNNAGNATPLVIEGDRGKGPSRLPKWIAAAQRSHEDPLALRNEAGDKPSIRRQDCETGVFGHGV
nr:hypothetical protein [Pirellulaceae bacterium]